jgi:hypothetical protein
VSLEQWAELRREHFVAGKEAVRPSVCEGELTG